MPFCRMRVVIVAGLLACAWNLPGSAQEKKLRYEDAAKLAGDLPELPAEFRDPEFDRFIDLRVLDIALTRQDAPLLCDFAIKLAEGERALSRSHKTMSADKALRLAIRMAGEQRDKETFARLATAVMARGNKELATLANDVKVVIGVPRKFDPNRNIAINEASPDSIVLFRTLCTEVDRYKMCKDKRNLDLLRKNLSLYTELHPKHRDHLEKVLDDATKVTPAATADPDDDFFGKLAASTRKTMPPGLKSDKDSVQARLQKGWVGVQYGEEVRVFPDAFKAGVAWPADFDKEKVMAVRGVAVYQHFSPRTGPTEAACYSYQPYLRWKPREQAPVK